MSEVIIKTKGGNLTDDDFVGDAPAPGSSDKKYSPQTLAELDAWFASICEEKK